MRRQRFPIRGCSLNKQGGFTGLESILRFSIVGVVIATLSLFSVGVAITVAATTDKDHQQMTGGQAPILVAQGDDDLLGDDDDLLGDDDDLLDDDNLLGDDDDFLVDDVPDEVKYDDRVVKDPNMAHAQVFLNDRYPSATQCASCHPKHYREWSISQHAYAQMSPVFNAMQGTIGRLTNGTLGDFCIRCHTPVGMNLQD